MADESSVPTDIRVSEGGSCTLECQASGTPMPQVAWMKNGQQIQASEHFFIESSANGVHRLLIKNAKYEHAGLYTAKVKQKVCTQSMNFNVIITGRHLRNTHRSISSSLVERKTTTTSATINLTGLSECSSIDNHRGPDSLSLLGPEQQVQQIQNQIRPLFLHMGLQEIPRALNEILFNTSQDRNFQSKDDQLKERERLLVLLGNYLYQNSNRQLGQGKRLNWPEVVKIIFYNRFPQIAQSHPIIDHADGYAIQINDLIQYSK